MTRTFYIVRNNGLLEAKVKYTDKQEDRENWLKVYCVDEYNKEHHTHYTIRNVKTKSEYMETIKRR